ncbi:hypothetical protein IL306_012087 [Fusarium sp. DS 682]|nr:hypothetical protein IL306_012087 [Fusarium sp. DS 682]
MSDEFSIFTSMRYDAKLSGLKGQEHSGKGWNFENDSPLYMLDLHRDRLLKAAKHWGWQPAVDQLSGLDGLSYLAQLITDCVGSYHPTPLKLKIVLSRQGDMKIEHSSTPEVPIQNLLPSRLPDPSHASLEGDPRRGSGYTLLLDRVSTRRSEYTHFKTTKRAMYDAARQRAGITYADPIEVLVVNQDNGSVMEGTFTTPYFWRNGHWVTPPVAAQFSWEEGNGGQDGTSRRWALERYVSLSVNNQWESQC